MKSLEHSHLNVSPVDDAFQRPAKEQAEGKGISLSPCGDNATKRALGFQPFSGLNIFDSSLWRSSSL
jgi:hypothetical protein